jgi:segregation and condensation protein B
LLSSDDTDDRPDDADAADEDKDVNAAESEEESEEVPQEDSAEDITEEPITKREAAPEVDAQGKEAGPETEAPGEEADREEVPIEEVIRRVEAVLFSNSEPMTPRELARSAKILTKQVREALAKLRLYYDETGRSFELKEEAGGYLLLTRDAFSTYVIAAEKKAGERKLSPAVLEVLSVIAYEQPVGRMDIEAVRGVASGPILRMLMEKGLIQVAGRSEGLGNALLYGTTNKFLEVLGIASLRDLPDPDTVES